MLSVFCFFTIFYTPKDTKNFLNLLSFGTLLNTFIFLNPPLPPFEGGNKYINVCHVSGHVLLRIGTRLPTCRDTSVTCRDTSSYVSGHVCHVSEHVLLRVGTRPPTCRDISSYVSGHVCHVSGYVCHVSGYVRHVSGYVRHVSGYVLCIIATICQMSLFHSLIVHFYAAARY